MDDAKVTGSDEMFHIKALEIYFLNVKNMG